VKKFALAGLLSGLAAGLADGGGAPRVEAEPADTPALPTAGQAF